jgi:Domain of unknown function (DUF4386)
MTRVRTARLTGLAYLGLAVCGMVGFLVVRARLHVSDDAAATAANLTASEGLARLGIAADLGTVLTQTFAAIGFLRLFRPVNDLAAGAVAAFGLVNAVVILVATAFSAVALETALTGAPTAAADAQLLYDLKLALWSVCGLFFGLWLIPMGWLVLRSGWMPELLGRVLVLGGVGYVLATFARWLLPDVPVLADTLPLAASVGEFWIVGYLLVRGVRTAGPQAPAVAVGP